MMLPIMWPEIGILRTKKLSMSLYFCMLEILLRSVKVKADPLNRMRRETEIMMGILSRVFLGGGAWRGDRYLQRESCA